MDIICFNIYFVVVKKNLQGTQDPLDPFYRQINNLITFSLFLHKL